MKYADAIADNLDAARAAMRNARYNENGATSLLTAAEYESEFSECAETALDAARYYNLAAYHFGIAASLMPKSDPLFCAIDQFGIDAAAAANDCREYAVNVGHMRIARAENDAARAIDAAAADDAAINAGDAAAPFDAEYWADIAPDGTSAAAIRRDGIRPIRDHY